MSNIWISGKTANGLTVTVGGDTAEELFRNAQNLGIKGNAISAFQEAFGPSEQQAVSNVQNQMGGEVVSAPQPTQQPAVPSEGWYQGAQTEQPQPMPQAPVQQEAPQPQPRPQPQPQQTQQVLCNHGQPAVSQRKKKDGTQFWACPLRDQSQQCKPWDIPANAGKFQSSF